MTSITSPIFKMAQDFSQDKKIDNAEVKKLIDLVLEDDQITLEETSTLRDIDNSFRNEVNKGGSSKRLWEAYKGGIADIPLYKKALHMEQSGGQISADEAQQLIKDVQKDGIVAPKEMATLRSIMLGAMNITKPATQVFSNLLPSITQPFERTDLAFTLKNPIPLTEVLKEDGAIRFDEVITDNGWESRIFNLGQNKKMKIDRTFNEQGRVTQIKVDRDNNGTVDETHTYRYEKNILKSVAYHEGSDLNLAKNKSLVTYVYSPNGIMEKELYSQTIDGSTQDVLEAQHTSTTNGRLIQVQHNKNSFKKSHTYALDAEEFPVGTVQKEHISLNKDKTVKSKTVYAASSKAEIDSRVPEEEAYAVNELSSVPSEDLLNSLKKNAQGQIISAEYNGYELNFSYNTQGQLSQLDKKKDPIKLQINYLYDPQNRIISETVYQKIKNTAGIEELKMHSSHTHTYNHNDIRTTTEVKGGLKIREIISNKNRILIQESQFRDAKVVYRRNFSFNNNGQIDEYSERYMTEKGIEVWKYKNTYKDNKRQQVTLTESFISPNKSEKIHSTIIEYFNEKGQLTERHNNTPFSSPIFTQFLSDFDTKDFKGRTNIETSFKRIEKFKYRGNGEFRSGTSTATEKYHYIKNDLK